MVNWLPSAVLTSCAFVAGILLGALLWRRQINALSRRSMRQQSKAFPALWDIHSVLNAMNKLALASERGRPIEPSLVYMLSDYLLHSALIQREDGWTDRDSLENWLLAHVRVLADHRGQTTVPAVNVQLREGVRRIHAIQLLRQILWVLQKAPTINRIQIKVLNARYDYRMVTVRVEVDGDQAELGKLLEDEMASRSWRADAGKPSCELRTAFEAAPSA